MILQLTDLITQKILNHEKFICMSYSPAHIVVLSSVFISKSSIGGVIVTAIDDIAFNVLTITYREKRRE